MRSLSLRNDREYWFLVLLVVGMLALAIGMAACASKPTTPLQDVYVSEQSLMVADQGIVDAHNAGLLVGANYDKVKAIAKQARLVLMDAETAAMAGDANRTTVLLTTATSLINQIAAYNGGKK